jgi:hypothetical protein
MRGPKLGNGRLRRLSPLFSRFYWWRDPIVGLDFRKPVGRRAPGLVAVTTNHLRSAVTHSFLHRVEHKHGLLD